MPSLTTSPLPPPEVHHVSLGVTFHGLVHPLSTAETPIYQYRGIKYASVPARFRQSRLCTAYRTFNVDCTKFGPICPQIKTSPTIEESLFGLSPEDLPSPQQAPPLKQNEFECLNLNITCPAGLTPKSRVPVMVWIHGGGDRGSGSSWIYDGGAPVRKSMLMAKPVILVTFNYRLGLFGFAASQLLREDARAAGEEGVGNYGLRDQQKALEWVHHYIADFGGDPHNLTLFGSSTGASDIVFQLLSSANDSRHHHQLFARAIVQSPILDAGRNIPDVNAAGWHVSRLMGSLGVSTIAQLRAVEPEKLLAFGQTLRAVDDGMFFRDGWREFLRSEDCHMHHHHREKKEGWKLQDLIIGDCTMDSMLWSLPASHWTSLGVERRLKAVCLSLARARPILESYDISAYTPEDEIVERVLELINDTRVAWPLHCFAQNVAGGGGEKGAGNKVWRYVFDEDGPRKRLPHHAAELMYLFDTVPGVFPPEPRIADEEDRGWFCDSFSDDEDDDIIMDEDARLSPVTDYSSSSWSTTTTTTYSSYTRVRDTIQERWISFANGEKPWSDAPGKVFVFGPEGETGERSEKILTARRRVKTWKDTFVPLGMELVHKVGLELSRGPPLGSGAR